MWKWREQMSDNINNTDNSDNEYERYVIYAEDRKVKPVR